MATFGNTATGTGFTNNIWSGQFSYGTFTGAVGTGVSISAYLATDGNGAGGTAQFNMYDHSNNLVTNGVTNVSGTLGTTPTWVTLNFATAPVFTVQTYQVCVWFSKSGGPGGNLSIARGTLTNSNYFIDNNSVTYKTWPGTITASGSTTNYVYSLYVTYTPPAGATTFFGWRSLMGVGQ